MRSVWEFLSLSENNTLERESASLRQQLPKVMNIMLITLMKNPSIQADAMERGWRWRRGQTIFGQVLADVF
jgi:hypothetical protein